MVYIRKEERVRSALEKQIAKPSPTSATNDYPSAVNLTRNLSYCTFEVKVVKLPQSVYSAVHSLVLYAFSVGLSFYISQCICVLSAISVSTPPPPGGAVFTIIWWQCFLSHGWGRCGVVCSQGWNLGAVNGFMKCKACLVTEKTKQQKQADLPSFPLAVEGSKKEPSSHTQTYKLWFDWMMP